MLLQKLSLVNFKNYEQTNLEFSSGLNCFVGNNGVGKTNILDAIYYLCLCKSNFNSVDSQNIKINNEFAVIQGEFVLNEKKEEIYCGIRKNKRKVFKRNKKEYIKFSDHIGLFPVVMISPADSNLILDGSEERRKFINGVIVQYDKNYLQDIIRYNKLIEQRNKLLKNIASSNDQQEDTLEIYDEQIIPAGESIFEKRLNFTKKLIPVFQKYYEFISSGKEKVDLFYQSQLTEGNFRDQLLKSKKKDKILQFTSVGIHKDDLILNLQGLNIKKIGSQGQQKTYLVALKLAKFDFIKEITGISPILLLDDNFGQIFVTHTNEKRMKAVLKDIQVNYRLFFISDGLINEIQHNEKKQHSKNK